MGKYLYEQSRKNVDEIKCTNCGKNCSLKKVFDGNNSESTEVVDRVQALSCANFTLDSAVGYSSAVAKETTMKSEGAMRRPSHAEPKRGEIAGGVNSNASGSAPKEAAVK